MPMPQPTTGELMTAIVDLHAAMVGGFTNVETRLDRVESGDAIRAFADEVAPAVRSAVSMERNRQGKVGSDGCKK